MLKYSKIILLFLFIVGTLSLSSKNVQAYTEPKTNNSNLSLEKCQGGWKYTPYLGIESDTHDVGKGSEFTVNVIINNAQDIYAQDINITYNQYMFQYIGAATHSTTDSAVGIKNQRQSTTTSAISIYYADESTSGKLRFILASNGSKNVVNGNQEVLKLKFKAKNIGGMGRISVSNGLVANGQGREFKTLCGGTNFRSIDCDVNNDGRISLGDLAITARLYEDKYYYWYNPKTDVDMNGKVDEIDLKDIVRTIVSN